MNIQRISNASYAAQHMIGESAKKSADRARESESSKRLEAIEEKRDALAKETKKAWVNVVVDIASSVLSVAAAFIDGGTSFAVKIAHKIGEAIVKIAKAGLQPLLGHPAAEKRIAAEEIEVEAEKEKAIATRKEALAREAREKTKDFNREMGTQVKELRRAVRV